MWLVGAYFLLELGELCLSPVGLSAVTKLAPTQLVGLAMGIWFLSNSAGNMLAGWAGTFFSTMPLGSTVRRIRDRDDRRRRHPARCC